VRRVDRPVRIASGVLALLILAGCAQQSSGGAAAPATAGIPGYVPTDRWYARTGETVGGIAAADRQSEIILGCERAGDTVTLAVSPQQKLPIDFGYRPVTIILNGHITYIQNWISLPEGYSIDSKDPGFRTTLEELQKHETVEFVLGRPGQDIDDRRFSLNGAKAAIDTILAACGKPW
jgi:hypothetical protein